MPNNNTLKSYLDKQYINYSRSSFQFGEYYVFLLKLIHGLNRESSVELCNNLNKFFIYTNLIDDIMDKDNEELENIDNLSNELPFYLNVLLKSIEENVPETQFSLFIDYISTSLIYQNIEHAKQITIETTENEYFSIYIKRSTFLLQAVVPFADDNASNSIYTATKYLAYFGQIKNDINNIRQFVSSDLINNRPTLPLIKVLEHGISENNRALINSLLSINENNYTRINYDEIIQFIKANDILEDCAKLALHFLNASKEEFILSFPSKEDYIHSFFRHFILKDCKDDS